MATWRLTKSLARFRQLVDERWPNRDHASDGTIGDAAHQAETSGHNADDTVGSKPEWNGDPDTVPEVRAFDMDSDLREPGTTAQMLVDHLIRLPGLSKVFRYIIFNRRIYRASTGWKAETYTGTSAHTEHIHFSGAYDQAADDNTTFDFRLDEVGDMPLTDDDVAKLVRAIFAYDPGLSKGSDGKMTAWPGISDETYADGGNGTVALGTAISSLLARQKGYGDGDRVAADALRAQLAALGTSLTTAITALAAKDQVDEQALAQALAPAVGAIVVASLPQGADQISQAEVTTAVMAAFADAFGSHE